jgi:short-subunit dehydrogenase
MNPQRIEKYFRGKKILITGGSSGIGKALAHALADMAGVAIVAHRPEALATTVEEFARDGLCVQPFTCDLSDARQTIALAKRVVEEFGPPDILVNNAGSATYRPFEQMPAAEVDALIEVNLVACLRLTHALLPGFIRRRSGAIVNIASIAGRLALTPNIVYAAAKHGMVAWSECLSYELDRFNIQVTVVCPGRVLTSFFDHETFRTRAARPEVRYTVPLSRVVNGTLESVARGRFLTYIPRTLGLLVWAKNTMPFIVEPLYRRLMLQRIETLYKRSEE